jgi:sugar/nucleoside kinase (ribokinase family)
MNTSYGAIENSYILDLNKEHASEKELSDAINLAESISSDVTLILQHTNMYKSEDKAISKIVYSESSKCKDFDPLIEIFNSFESNKRLLFIVIGGSERVKKIIKAIELERGTPVAWEVLNASVSRIEVLERHRGLSTYIPIDTRIWISSLIRKYSPKYLIDQIELISSLRILTIGEIIIDQYIACEALGRVSKDPLVAFSKGETSRQLGGILAAANNLNGLGAKVDVISEIDSILQNEIIRELPGVDFSGMYVSDKNSSVIKTRYFDSGSGFRLFETYEMRSTELAIGANTNKRNEFFLNAIQRTLKNVDGVVLIDFGHGLFSSEIIKSLEVSSKPSFVNAQSNAGNRGFNPISRYKGFDNIFLNGGELEIELRKRSKDVPDMCNELGRDLEATELYVTQGARGLVVWEKNGTTFNVPAFAPTIRDRVGAGDALLSMIAPLRIAGVEIDIAAFYGNIAGALLVSGLGNQVQLTVDRCRSEADEILHTVLNEA